MDGDWFGDAPIVPIAGPRTSDVTVGRALGRRGFWRWRWKQGGWRNDAGARYLERVTARPIIDLDLTLDGAPLASETTCTWAGAYVLTVHSVIPRADLALELHSTFIGHPGVDTHAAHLILGPPGRAPELLRSDHDELDPILSPRGCVYEHAQRLIEVLDELGHRVRVDVPGEGAFAQLERAEPKSA